MAKDMMQQESMKVGDLNIWNIQNIEAGKTSVSVMTAARIRKGLLLVGSIDSTRMTPIL